jgi:hypothetical protein
MPVTIVFRGLMAFAQPHPPSGRMEIGVLKAPQHFPRILTMKRGVWPVSSTFADAPNWIVYVPGKST